uniref:Uncharacterized protein n=1 Tax=Brugia malayi TaxID=6279 RepID=A0A7I4KRY9_BRUMA
MPPLNSRQKFPQESKGQKIQKRKNSSIFQKNFTVEQKNNSGTTIKAIRTIDEHFSIDEHHVIYTAHSPYIITPEQKITQQLLSTEMVTSIGCSVDDIAQLLRYIALYGELSEDEIYQTPLTFIRLVVRGKTKFDKDDSKREQKPVPKSESKLGLYNDKEISDTMKKWKKNMQQRQVISPSKPKKKTRGNELSNRLISDNKVKRSSRRGNAMRKGKRKKNRKKKSSKSRLSRQLVEAASPHAHERMLNKGLRMKRSRKVRGLRRKENGKHFNS